MLYCDADSLVYTWREGQFRHPIGDFLGEFTDELVEKNGTVQHIVESVSAGPKNYAYRLENDAAVVKVKGFSLSRCAGLLTFERVRDVACATIDPETLARADAEIAVGCS